MRLRLDEAILPAERAKTGLCPQDRRTWLYFIFVKHRLRRAFHPVMASFPCRKAARKGCHPNGSRVGQVWAPSRQKNRKSKPATSRRKRQALVQRAVMAPLAASWACPDCGIGHSRRGSRSGALGRFQLILSGLPPRGDYQNPPSSARR